MKPFHDNHFESIQALRGIVALFIALEHIRFLNCGAFGVDIFFIISGFMIMFSTHKSSKHFLSKRIIRIVPLYYLMTLGTFLLLLLFPSMFEQTKANPVFLLKSLAFIPFDIGGGVLQPIVRIGWTINCEVFFYLLFFIAMKINHKYRGLLCCIFLGVPVLIAQLTMSDFVPLTFYGNPIMLEFVFGILSYYICLGIYHAYYNGKLSKSICYAAIPVGLVLLIILAITKKQSSILGFHRLSTWGLPAMIIVLCFFVAGLVIKIPRPLVMLGNISFSFYLLHYYPIMLLDRKVFDFSACTPYTLLGVFVSIIICILLAYACWYLVEYRFTKWLRRTK